MPVRKRQIGKALAPLVKPEPEAKRHVFSTMIASRLVVNRTHQSAYVAAKLKTGDYVIGKFIDTGMIKTKAKFKNMGALVNGWNQLIDLLKSYNNTVDVREGPEAKVVARTSRDGLIYYSWADRAPAMPRERPACSHCNGHGYVITEYRHVGGGFQSPYTQRDPCPACRPTVR